MPSSAGAPNNSFKPNLLRYTNNMAGKACHVVGSATQVGLTQALKLMRIFLAAVAGAVVLLGSCSTRSFAGSDGPLVSELLMLTGPDALRCGLVPLGQDPSHAWECAQAADSSNKPHWFAMQRQGIDSEIWVASLLTPSGQRFILTYDSNYMGGSGLLPRYTRDACRGHVVLAPATQAGLQCSRQ